MGVYSYQEKRLLAAILNLPLNQVFTGDFILTPGKQKEFEEKRKRLNSGYPLDYLIGTVEFLGKHFKVTPDVLIPRPETEFWVQELKNNLLSKDNNKPSLLVDLGTGSGVVGLSLTQYFNQVFLVDISKEALDVAKFNSSNIGPGNASVFLSDLLTSTHLKNRIQQFVLENGAWVLVANLPYLPLADKLDHQKTNVRYEPDVALYSGDHGLDLAISLCRHLQRIKDGKDIISVLPQIIALELDPRNIEQLRTILSYIYDEVSVLVDDYGLDRVLLGKI